MPFTYVKPYAWKLSDIKLQCSYCNYSTEVKKGRSLPENLDVLTSKGRRYLGCSNCQNGFLKIFTKTKNCNWRLKARTLFTEAIKWKSNK